MEQEKMSTVGISMQAKMLHTLRVEAAKRGMSRSGLIRALAEKFLRGEISVNGEG